MPSLVDVNETRFPLVVVTMRGDISEQAFAGYLTQLEQIYRRRERLALVLDLSAAGVASAALRKQQADWLRDHAMVIRALNVGTALVIKSTIVRGALTAILWMQPLPCPYDLFDTTPNAIRWAEERLRAAGLHTGEVGVQPG